MSYKRIDKCRVCGNTNLVDVLDLGSHALAGVFPDSKDRHIPQMPLILTKCHGDESCCQLLQLAHTYDPVQMYGDNYGYRSGLNKHIVDHLQQKVQAILDAIDLNGEDLVLDIGSNDGTTLSFYPRHVKSLVGIDPTSQKFAEYQPDHLELISDFFSKRLFVEKYGTRKAKVITSFAMFYDLPDPVGFAREVAEVLHDQGIWVLEQSYMPTMLKKCSYDTICHEHLEYYGLQQIKWIMERANMEIIDVHFNNMNGGSFSVTVAHPGFLGAKFYEKVENVLSAESVYSGLNPFQKFAKEVQAAKGQLVNRLVQLKSEGKKVAGLGASTKGNVILQYCQLDSSLLPVIGEVNEDKFGKYTPGTQIPIRSEDWVIEQAPDYLLVLPWHLHTFFKEAEKFKDQNLIYPIDPA